MNVTPKQTTRPFFPFFRGMEVWSFVWINPTLLSPSELFSQPPSDPLGLFPFSVFVLSCVSHASHGVASHVHVHLLWFSPASSSSRLTSSEELPAEEEEKDNYTKMLSAVSFVVVVVVVVVP